MDKKILQISPYYFSHIGWVEKYAEILEKIFTKNNENLEFSTFCGGKDFEIIEPVQNCPLPKFWTKDFWNFLQKIKQNPPKIIISHIRFAPTAWMSFWLAKSLKIPYIHIEHGTGFLIHKNFFIKNIAKFVDLTIGKYILKNADFVICVSQSSQNWIKNFTKRNENITTIYRGFEIKNFSKISEKNTENTIKIGFVGRLVSLKNLSNLIFALQRMRDIHWQLEIVGDGEMRSEWEKLVKNCNLQEKIIFHGKKENSWILEKFLPNIDIFVNPSLQEWLPTTCIEAKIAGCEVLATNVGGTTEIPDIYLCEPTEFSINKNLEKIIKNPQKNHISKEFLEKFSLEKMKENYLKIFKKI